MELTFEEEIDLVMQKYYNGKNLSSRDIKMCRALCDTYDNKLYANDLSNKIRIYSKVNDTELEIENCDKIEVSLYEHFNFCVDKNMNKKDQTTKILVNFDEKIIEIVYEESEDYSDDGRYKYLFYKFFIYGNLILRKEHKSLKKDFINLSYLKELFKKLKIKTSIVQFLRLFLKVLDVSEKFDKLLTNIEQNPDKYYFDKSWNSDSDLSMSDCSD